MLIRDASDSVEITLREMGPRDTPAEGDLGVNVAVSGRAFSGHNNTVWISCVEWGDFLHDVAEVTRLLRGEARVVSMSPEEFTLRLFAANRAGHVAAEGWVGRERTARGGTLSDRACFSIALDASALEELLHQFKMLGSAG